MEPAIKKVSPNWDDFKLEFEKRLEALQKQENNPIVLAQRAVVICLDALRSLQNLEQEVQLGADEEVRFYKEIRPFFISQLIYFNRLVDLELEKSTCHRSELLPLYERELGRISGVYEQHRFICRYLRTGATYLDDRLFFRADGASVIAMFGGQCVSDASSQVCYDRVVAEILAADLLRKKVEDAIEIIKDASDLPADLPRLVWTDTKTSLIELAYAWYASRVFNNGNVNLKDIVHSLEVVFHVDLGHYPRSFQDNLSRKSGYTKGIDRWSNNLVLYINKIEEKHIR